MSYRQLDFSIEVPDLVDAPLVSPVTDMGQTFVGVALDLTDNLVAGRYRVALTLTEARALHAALGAALAEVPKP